MTDFGKWKPVWVTDFPMFERDSDVTWQALYHPFTAPQQTSIEKLLTDPAASLSRAYYLVLNGNEIGGGPIHIHDILRNGAQKIKECSQHSRILTRREK